MKLHELDSRAGGATRTAPFVLVTGGKGGVGKSTLTADLGVHLAVQGQRVLLVDLDLGLANLDVLLGLGVGRTVEDALEGRCDLEDCVVTGPQGVHVLPAGSGATALFLQRHLPPGCVVWAVPCQGDAEGLIKHIRAQVCDVSKPLMSVHKLVEAGHSVVFAPGGSYIQDGHSGDVMWLRSEECLRGLRSLGPPGTLGAASLGPSSQEKK